MAKITTCEDTKEIALTIYNAGFGAVKERRTVLLENGVTELIYADVSLNISVRRSRCVNDLEPVCH